MCSCRGGGVVTSAEERGDKSDGDDDRMEWRVGRMGQKESGR